ncbi:MAG TPA: hypothetical protein VIM61_04270 [Chthoniobacterales bacterium]|jgi:hypothetical protein
MSAPRCLLALLLLSAASAPAGEHRNAIPPRLQWEANGGYCGEVSLISAGLYFGQYLSQYDARICAIGRTPQDRGELLLGVNDVRAADRMHLKSVTWDDRRTASPARFLQWVKRQVLRGRPVAIGVYNNEFKLYGRRAASAGDPQYDHIVPVSRIRSQAPLHSRRYHGTDRVTFSDNGLWGTRHFRYFFPATFAKFPGNRAQANDPRGPIYRLPDYGRNFGIAILGVKDRDGDTLPVRVATNRNDEVPAMARHSTDRPKPMPLTLTVTVSGLVPGVAYRLYRYDDLASIPEHDFNAAAGKAAQVWDLKITAGSAFTLRQDILSDEVAAYRCVPASAR